MTKVLSIEVTRFFWGKPYHWEQDDNGTLRLIAGEAEAESEVA